MNNRVAAGSMLLLAATWLFAQPAKSEGDADVGAELGYSCLGCHGIEGYRNAYPSYRVPKLGGQKAAYIELALKAYRDGSRAHPTMEAQASSLSDQDIEDVAAYLVSMTDKSVDTVAGNETEIEAAKPCAICHGPAGISVNPMWPTLAGQHEDYLLQSLQAYKQGVRKDPTMAAQALMIAEQDIEILAEYFASLDGLETTEID